MFWRSWMVRYFSKQLLRFVAAIVLLALSLCALEVGFRAYKLQQTFTVAQQQDTPQTKFVETSRTTYLDVPPLLDVNVSLAGGAKIPFHTNSWGLRGKEVSVPKQRGTFRVLCLGNGDTLAPEIQEPETLVAGLQTRLQSNSSLPVEVLNAGCPDAGPIVNMLRGQKLLGLQPDLIVLVVSPEDVYLDEEVRRFLRLDDEGIPSYACHPLLRQGESLVDDVCKEFCTAEWLAETAGQKLFKGIKTTSGMRGMNSEITSLPQDFDERLVEMPFLQVAQLAERIYARHLIVVYPTPWDLARERKLAQPDPRSPHALLLQVATENSLPLCDLFGDFQHATNLRNLYSGSTGRLTAAGHALIADRVSQFIVTHISGSWGQSVEPQSRPVPEIGDWPAGRGL